MNKARLPWFFPSSLILSGSFPSPTAHLVLCSACVTIAPVTKHLFIHVDAPPGNHSMRIDNSRAQAAVLSICRVFLHSCVLAFLLLSALAACKPVPIPTSDDTPTPRSTQPPLSLPTLVAPFVAQPAATPLPTDIAPTVTATPEVLPEGGSVTVGAVASYDYDVNALPSFLSSAIYDSLLIPNPATGALEPGLAESFQVSSDMLTITFRLRAGLRWHNGDPLTATDVLATIEAFSSPDFRGVALVDFGAVTKAAALDERTVQLSLREAYCPALTSIGTMKIVPRAVALSSNFPRLKPEQLIGSGPLKIQTAGTDPSLRDGSQFTFVRNESYYRGPVHIDTWTLKLYPDSAALRNAFAAKQIDVMDGPPGDYARLSKLPGANLIAGLTPKIAMLLFNVDTYTLDDSRVRQALVAALNPEMLLGDIAGQGQIVHGSALPGYWATTTELPPHAYDLNRAKELFAPVGWRDPGDGVLRRENQPMILQLWTEADDPVLEPIAFRIREQYAALGIQVELELDDRAGTISHAAQHRFDLLLISRRIPLDPDQRWYWQADQNAKGNGLNFGSYANPRLETLFKESVRVSGCTSTARSASFAEIQRNLLTDPPAVFLFAPKQYLVARDSVLKLAVSPFTGNFGNLNEWRIKPVP